MVMSAGAAFLQNLFEGFDHLFLSFYHSICCAPLTLLTKLITLIGEKGIIFFLAAVLMMCFSKTRKTGICLFGAVACGALITNIILKDLVARPRPFYFAPYDDWYKAVGAPFEDDFSFPSGHATSAAAGMLALRLRNGKKWTVPAIVWVLLTCLSRNYLIAHYPSDVLIGSIIGAASAVIAWMITELIYRILSANEGTVWADFVLNWSIPDVAGIPSRLGLIGTGASPEFRRKTERPQRDRDSEKTGRPGRATQPSKTAWPERTAQPEKRTAGMHSSGYVGKHSK